MGLLDKLFGEGAPLGEFLTAGPPEDEHPLLLESDFALALHRADRGAFVDGWLGDATCRKVPAHPGRVGGTIKAGAVVLHTTDMAPRTWEALLKSWANNPGAGAAAHFGIGRSPEQGLVQFVSILKNANHAGGKVHGNFRTPSGALVHPNVHTIGIEIHGHGALRWKAGEEGHTALAVEGGKAVGTYSEADIYIDGRGKPWHRVTQWQLDTLHWLLRSLRYSLEPNHNTKMTVVPDAKHDVTNGYGVAKKSTLVGHVSLDPINKTDPGPQVMSWLDTDSEAQVWR